MTYTVLTIAFIVDVTFTLQHSYHLVMVEAGDVLMYELYGVSGTHRTCADKVHL